jgi:hypothetical protein
MNLFHMKSAFNFLVLTVFLTYMMTGCSNPQSKADETDLPEWLAGNRADTSLGFYEGWTISGDTMLTGYGYQLVDNDTIFKESLLIRKTGNTWNYIVRHGNKETVFALINTPGDSLVFDNPVNEFPKRITYLNKDEENIVVVIENPGDRNNITRFNFIPLK